MVALTRGRSVSEEEGSNREDSETLKAKLGRKEDTGAVTPPKLSDELRGDWVPSWEAKEVK